jgi:hypothetical protein
MLAVIQSKIFVFQSQIKKNKDIKYKNIVILPGVLYGWEACPPTSGEKHRLRVFENRVLRKICGTKRRKTDRGENFMMNFTACINR